MSRVFFKSFILVSLIIPVLSITTSCNSASDDSTWHTVFYDDFNRADGDLGSNWNIVSSVNASLEVKDNRALYTTTSGFDNTIVAYSDSSNGIDSNKIIISLKVTTDSNFADIETIGFIIKPSPETGKQYYLTFNKTYFALGTKNSDAAAWTWLDTKTPNLADNTTYYLEFNVDGTAFSGCIKDADKKVIHEINVTNEEYSSWNTYFVLKSNGGSTAVKFDDYRIEAYY